MTRIDVYHPIISVHSNMDTPRLSNGEIITVMNAITKNTPCNTMASFSDAVSVMVGDNPSFIRFSSMMQSWVMVDVPPVLDFWLARSVDVVPAVATISDAWDAPSNATSSSLPTF
mmetsp:Transcript_20826/g.31625  ORF Transcript_20826/g.31625 Transcript_20826/m.31625 type:complete len:115 (+) Transcript_20826:58-402(+)